MQIELDTGALAALAGTVAKRITRHPTAPVLSAIVLNADPVEGTLTGHAFDYETSIQITTQATITDPGRILVQGKLLAEIAGLLPAGNAVTIGSDGTRATVQCGKGKFTLMLMPDDVYPSLPELPAIAGRIGSDLLASAITQVGIAVGADDSLPALTGIRMEFHGDTITLVATDRYRLALRELQWEPEIADLDLAVLAQGKALKDVMHAFTGSAQTAIHLTPSEDTASSVLALSGNTVQYTTRLLAGEYPRYQTLIPSEFKSTAEINVDQLTAAVKRVALVAERNTPVRLTFTADEVLMEAGTGDEAQATEVLPATYTGDGEMRIAFNPQYLLDGLGVILSDTAEIHFTTPTRPAVLTGKTGEDQSAPDFRYVLMPIRSAG